MAPGTGGAPPTDADPAFDVFPVTMGADLSLVTAFLSCFPFEISERSAPLDFSMGGRPPGGGGGGGGPLIPGKGGGGGGGMVVRLCMRVGYGFRFEYCTAAAGVSLCHLLGSRP